MEDAIFNKVESFFLDLSKWYCETVKCHMKQRNEIKIAKLLAKFKWCENEKVFKAKQEKNIGGKKFNRFCKIYAFFHPSN